ncbi:GNAT family N-acetyltransferase [Falsiruegeria litorea]|nr:GNAT family N-acetyltransferase [Falsiruegeria litorea]MBT3141432.1 GNAT family N-acetyltransferase [Falsiruegeria litorea]
MIREATQDDAVAIDAFLAEHAASSMFLRSNLASQGVGISDHPHSSRIFLREVEGIVGVFGVTKGGYLMVQMPDLTSDDATAFARSISGSTVLGMTGPTAQVETTLVALGLDNGEFRLNHDEPLYRLELSQMSAQTVDCRPMEPSDVPLLEGWFAQYLTDTNQASADEAKKDEAKKIAPARARSDLETGRVRLLVKEGQAVAMASLNAIVSDHVQVGGVYVPCDMRGRGYGRDVTLGLLQEAKGNGKNVAVLFANNPPAARAYEAIGFEQVGWYRIALLGQPQEIRS